MKYLVTGSQGQLGKEFIRYLKMNGLNHTGVDIDDIDIGSKEDITGLIESVKPGIIINCAAFNLVDDAEKDPGPAYKTNAGGTANLTHKPAGIEPFIIHFGTDYVFDGEKKDGLYTEKDSPNPINEYGKSKLEGERLLAEAAPGRHLIFRVSWVYGHGRQNFIHKLFGWADSKRYLDISFDEVSVPTNTKTIVNLTMRSIKKGLTGTYHLVNSGYASRYEWAKTALGFTGRKNILYPVSRDVFNLPAKRPYFAAMSNLELSNELDIDIPHWEEDLKSFLAGM